MTMYVNPLNDQQPSEREILAADAAERRRAQQTKRKFVTQMTPWSPGVPSVPFDVIIDDISETGVGVIHDQPLPIGVPHLLTVPRGEQGRSIIREYVVIRCDVRPDGKYAISLQVATTREARRAPAKRVCGRDLKLLFLLFGIAGLLAATFLPLQ